MPLQPKRPKKRSETLRKMNQKKDYSTESKLIILLLICVAGLLLAVVMGWRGHAIINKKNAQINILKEDIYDLKDEICRIQNYSYFQPNASTYKNYSWDACCIPNCGGISCTGFEKARKEVMKRENLACGGSSNVISK